MSFILDALRKSESERQREAAPSLARAPLAAVRRETPPWVWLVLVLLLVALAAVAAAWWQSAGEGRAVAGPAAAVTAPPAASADRRSDGAAAATAAEARPAAADSPPRPVRELARIEPGLPAYGLDFVAYNSADPASSSAWINGERYRPGEQIGSGPELVEIRPDSVILAWAGERFILSVR